MPRLHHHLGRRPIDILLEAWRGRVSGCKGVRGEECLPAHDIVVDVAANWLMCEANLQVVSILLRAVRVLCELVVVLVVVEVVRVECQP